MSGSRYERGHRLSSLVGWALKPTQWQWVSDWVLSIGVSSMHNTGYIMSLCWLYCSGTIGLRNFAHKRGQPTAQALYSKGLA